MFSSILRQHCANKSSYSFNVEMSVTVRAIKVKSWGQKGSKVAISSLSKRKLSIIVLDFGSSCTIFKKRLSLSSEDILPGTAKENIIVKVQSVLAAA